jgi:uncharacterized protein (TIGR00730 family)
MTDATPPARSLRRVCVYAGSSGHLDARYHDAARALGQELVERGIGLVFGGGRVGLMGTIADAVLAGGGEVLGVIPQKLQALELGHEGCTELFVVDSMHARKMMMAQLSDAFVALPGGFGTFEELFEVTTWTQLNFHTKPVGVLNVHGYYDHLLAFLAHAGHEGFIRPLHQGLIHSADDPAVLIERLVHAEIPELARWISKP